MSNGSDPTLSQAPPALAGPACAALPMSRHRRTGRLRFVGAACLLIVLAGYLAWQWSRRTDIAALHDTASRRLHTLNGALFAPIDKFSYLPELAAGYPLMAQVLENQDSPALVGQANLLLQHLNDAAKSAVVYLLNQQGVVIASSNWQEPDSFIGNNYSFRPYFRDALQSGRGQFYGMGTTSLLPGYYVSSPVVRSGAAIGVAVVKIDMSRFDSNWKSRDEMTVSDGNGVIFLSSRSDWKYRPMHPLPDSVMNQMKRTRQYENALKAPLRSSVVEEIGPGEQLLRIGRIGGATAGGPHGANTLTTGVDDGELFFAKNEKLAGSDWSIHILTPINEIETRARRFALLGAAGFAFIALLCLYIEQVRSNARERESARLALENAHGALEQQHRRLQTISEELRRTSATDPLTSAYNRRYFFDAMEQILAAHRRTDGVLSIVMIDVDHFKQINDRHGHPAGDCVLKTLTALAHGVLRDADLFARFGGEEFIIALPNAAGPEAIAAAERLRERVLAAPFDCGGTPIDVHISCGVAQHRNDAESIEETIRRADQALYKAKDDGRNRVVML